MIRRTLLFALLLTAASAWAQSPERDQALIAAAGRGDAAALVSMDALDLCSSGS